MSREVPPRLREVSVLLSAEEIQRRVKELAEEISRDYEGKVPLLVNVLKGGVIFLADLTRSLRVPHHIDFLAVTSYGHGTESSGAVRILSDLSLDIRSRHVLIVEDIVDTGLTLSYIRNLLLARGPSSVKICTLMDKKERRRTHVPLDYVGFTIPNAFVVGYGLDLDEYYRNLTYVGVPNDLHPSESS